MKRLIVILTMALAVVAAPIQAAQAHVERPSYWPDPAPDTSIKPPVGGKVPTPMRASNSCRYDMHD